MYVISFYITFRLDAILNNKIFVEPRMVISKDGSNSHDYIVSYMLKVELMRIL